MSNIIAISIGDINGIGIEILLDLWKKNKIRKFVLFCNMIVLKNYLNKKKIKININCVNLNNQNYKKNYFNIYDYKCSSPEENTISSIAYGYKECKKGNYLGLITLPLRKDKIIKKINRNFIGHTEFLQKLDNKNTSNMILYHNQLIITPITTHIKLKSVSSTINKKNFLFNKIISLNKCLIKDFNIKKPKILISGINPHSGENGKIGNEEVNRIKPIINILLKKGIIIDGPSSADTMLNNVNIEKYDCFVFIYHDQALIPFKYISKFEGVNYTGNLDIIRTSPDHGTAYNLVGKKKFSNKSLINCFKLIKLIHQNRNNEKTKKITRTKFFKR